MLKINNFKKLKGVKFPNVQMLNKALTKAAHGTPYALNPTYSPSYNYVIIPRNVPDGIEILLAIHNLKIISIKEFDPTAPTF